MKLKEIIGHIMHENEERRRIEEQLQGSSEAAEQLQKAVTVRLDEKTIFELDYLADRLEGSRAETMRLLITHSLADAFEAAGVTEDEVWNAFKAHVMKRSEKEGRE